MSEMLLSVVVAMSENRVIGRDNALPWHIPDDLKFFRELTMGHPVIMGRKTFQSILSSLGNPLPGRTNIVISKKGHPEIAGHRVCEARDLESAVRHAETTARGSGVSEVFIIGGAEVFSQALLLADRIYLTRIHRHIKGDTFFPETDMSQWEEVSSRRLEGDTPITFSRLDRRGRE